MFIQVMPEKEAATDPYNPFDLTKVWFDTDDPLIGVGVLELNRNPEIGRIVASRNGTLRIVLQRL